MTDADIDAGFRRSQEESAKRRKWLILIPLLLIAAFILPRMIINAGFSLPDAPRISTESMQTTIENVEANAREITDEHVLPSKKRQPQDILWSILSMKNIVIIVSLVVGIWILTKSTFTKFNVVMIWIIVPLIRFFCSYLLVEAVGYMIMQFVPYNRTWGRAIWVIGGPITEIGIYWATIQLFLKGFSKPASGDMIRQIEFAGTLIPGVGANLPAVVLPRIIGLDIKDQSGKPLTIDVGDKDTTGSANTLDLQVVDDAPIQPDPVSNRRTDNSESDPPTSQPPTPQASARRTAWLKVLVQTKLKDTYKTLKYGQRPEDISNIARSKIVAEVESQGFSKLIDKTPKSEHGGKSLLASITAKVKREINDSLKEFGLELAKLELFDLNEPKVILDARIKSYKDMIGRNELIEAAKERKRLVDEYGPDILNYLADARIDDGTVEQLNVNSNGTNGPRGRGRGRNRGNGTNLNLFGNLGNGGFGGGDG